MQNFKSIRGVIGALIPVLYCGGLLYYFLDVAGSVQEAEEIGLGPTVLGLSAVGLLFSIPLILKVLRLFRRLRPPGSNGGDDDDNGGFDADAAIARYLARRSAEEAAVPAPRPAPQSGGPGKPGPGSGFHRPSFGRKS